MTRPFLIPFCLLITMASVAQRKSSIEENWHFHRGGVINGEMTNCDDSDWRIVTLPHDYSIEPAIEVKDQRPRTERAWEEVQVGPFTRLNYGDSDQGQTVGGEGWYRKTISLPLAAGQTLKDYLSKKQVSVLFDGIYNNAEVWINGRKMAMNVHGYMPFSVSLNDALCNGEDSGNNITIAVRTLNVDHNSRWYSGSGIYRHVWLVTTGKQHLDAWDVYVDGSQVIPKKGANIKIHAKVHNEEAKAVAGTVAIDIIDASGRKVAGTALPYESKGKSDGKEIEAEVLVKTPHLWSVDNPYRYTARISVMNDGVKNDEIDVKFGIRTIGFSAKEGFTLNGRRTILRGGCVHHDNGLLGAAAIDRAEVRKAELLKAQGYNAVRCSHNLPTEAFLNACDSLGLLVIDEVFDQWEVPKRPDDYGNYFSKEKQQIVDGNIVGMGVTNFEYDAALMVRRDRNHPSVIIWSIGNEVYQRDEPRGQEIAKVICKVIKSYDTTRPTTLANCTYWDQPGKTWEDDSPRAFENVDLGGYNYATMHYENDHRKFPERIIVGTESYPGAVAENYNFIDKHPYVIGDFVWTAIDYVGEAGVGHTFERTNDAWVQLMSWPWFNAWCGDIDLIGDKKPQSHYRDVVWGRSNIEMAVRPAIPVGEHEEVRGWGWTAEERHWNWGLSAAHGTDGCKYLPIELRPENYQIASTIRSVKHDVNAYRSDSLRVNVYSRARRVRLINNGRIIGEKDVNPENYTATFWTSYEPGELKAEIVGKVPDKSIPSSISFKTSKAPAAIRIDALDTSLTSSHNDIAYLFISVVDEEGNLCPTAELPLNIETSGVTHIATAGTAHPYDMKSFRSLTPKSFRGRAVLLIHPQDKAGKVNIKVSSQGLKTAEYDLVIGN